MEQDSFETSGSGAPWRGERLATKKRRLSTTIHRPAPSRVAPDYDAISSLLRLSRLQHCVQQGLRFLSARYRHTAIKNEERYATDSCLARLQVSRRHSSAIGIGGEVGFEGLALQPGAHAQRCQLDAISEHGAFLKIAAEQAFGDRVFAPLLLCVVH
jgi:hypothetical protein